MQPVSSWLVGLILTPSGHQPASLVLYVLDALFLMLSDYCLQSSLCCGRSHREHLNIFEGLLRRLAVLFCRPSPLNLRNGGFSPESCLVATVRTMIPDGVPTASKKMEGLQQDTDLVEQLLSQRMSEAKVGYNMLGCSLYEVAPLVKLVLMCAVPMPAWGRRS